MNSFESVLQTFKKAKEDLGEILSSCEYIDALAMESVTGNLNLKLPTSQKYPFYMLIESSGSNGKHDEEKLNTFLEDIMSKEIVADGTVASGPSHMLVSQINFFKLQYFWVRLYICEIFYHRKYGH